MRHSIKIDTNTYRVDWPFFRMHVGDSFYVKGKKAKELKTRAVSAYAYWRRAYGKQFMAIKINEFEYQIIRYK